MWGKIMNTLPTYIDIFAGCGGLSTGLFCAGWTGLFAIEKNDDAFSTLKHNLIDKKKHFLWPEWLTVSEHDIDEFTKKYMDKIQSLQGKVTLIAGGPPCQGFSLAGKRDKDDQRNKLIKSYIKIIRIIKPEVIILENVYGFTVNFKEKKGTKRYSSYVERALRHSGYRTSYRIIDMSEYGIPQKRKRFILIAMKTHDPKLVFSTLESNKEKFLEGKGIRCETTVYEAISDLEKVHGVHPSPESKGFLHGVYGPIQSGYQRLMRQSQGGKVDADSHRFANHRNETVELHNDLLYSAPRGKRITPNDKIVQNLNRRGVTVLSVNSQAPTITSIPDEIVHYCEPRILTVREHARIQGFPDWFEFRGKYTSGGKRRKQEVPRYTQVGNAVPPLFAEQIGVALLEVLSS